VSTKILLVEDDRDLSDGLRLRLETRGYEVVAAYDGEEGMKLVGSDHPDLVVLDLIMPKCDGFTMIREMKRSKELSVIPIIVITARRQMKDLCELEGVTDYLSKPFDGEDLINRINWNLKRVAHTSTATVENTAPDKEAKKKPTGKSVLIVEDDPELAQMLSVRLESANYVTAIVNNGEDALASIKQQQPHLVVMDVMMPKLDGYSTFKEINKMADPRIPVIVMTAAAAVSEEEYRIEGACAFLRKPIDGANLVKQVNEVLGDQTKSAGSSA
jgi:DNA-binding response OmpR family regulator